MILVVDANCLLQLLPSISHYHWIWSYFRERKFYWAFTTEILLEYEEVFSRWAPTNVVHNTIRAIVDSPNGIEVNPSYFWQIIDQDKDDNKYFDCSVAANADYIISDDRHFNILETTNFPKMRRLKINELKPSMFDKKS